jgi:hypothetical protein
MKKQSDHPYRTLLTIVVGFLLVYLLTGRQWAIMAALAIGIPGLFSPWFTCKISHLWMQLARLLSLVVPNILLSLVFFLVLTPLAIASRLLGQKDPLFLRNRRESTFREVDKTFDRASLEKPW